MRDSWRQGRQLARERQLDRASELRDNGRYEEAAELAEAVLRRTPSSLRARDLAAILRLGKDFERATASQLAPEESVERLEPLVAEHPDQPELLLTFASNLIAANELERAQEAATGAVALRPADPHVLTRAADGALFWAKDLQLAASWAHRAREILLGPDPPLDFAYETDLAHLEGFLLFHRGERDAGLELMMKAFEAEPDGIYFGDRLGACLIAAAEPARALEVVDRSLEWRPDSAHLKELRAHAEGMLEEE